MRTTASNGSGRIRLVSITTLPGLGFLAGQAGYMGASGLEVKAISSPGRLLDQFAERERASAHAVPMVRHISPLRDLIAIVRLYRLLRRLRPTIVHAHHAKSGLLGMITAWMARVPLRIYHVHGLRYMTATGLNRLILRWTEQISCLLAHQVLCVSHSVRSVAVEEGICPAGKIRVLLGGSINGIDADGRFNPAVVGARARRAMRERYHIPDHAMVAGFVGRIVRDKGLVELTGAWKVLRREFPELHLLVVGPFEPHDPVPRDVEMLLRGDDRIHLTGEIDEMPPLYAAMDLVVLPSYREGLPNVPLEAAAMALPVVATRIPGCRDAVADGLTGMLVPLRDTAALVDAIRGYLDDPELRRRHGLAGRQRVLSEFQREAIWEATYQVYSELLRAAGLPVPAPSAGATPIPDPDVSPVAP